MQTVHQVMSTASSSFVLDGIPFTTLPDQILDNEEHVSSETPHPQHTDLVHLHRGQVFCELVKYFVTRKDMVLDNFSLKIQMVLPNGSMELGEDEGSVIRDAIVEFWDSFKAKCTAGDTLCVPVVSVEMQEDEWQAIAKVLVVGFKQEQYLPAFLSPFLKQCLGIEPSAEELIKAFLHYVESYDRNILEKALVAVETVDRDDLLSILSQYDCKKLPTEENLKTLLADVAHKELVQLPAFIETVWSPILVTHLKPLLPDSIDALIDNLSPSTKRVLQILTFEENPDAHTNQLIEMVKKYVKSLDAKYLALFLRYCTGKFIMYQPLTYYANRSTVLCTYNCTYNFYAQYRCFSNIY